jgi:hypothetical protein
MFITQSQSKNLHFNSSLSNRERGRGGLLKNSEPDYMPERGTYFGQKGLVPTFAARLFGSGKELSVESRLAIDDDLNNR